MCNVQDACFYFGWQMGLCGQFGASITVNLVDWIIVVNYTLQNKRKRYHCELVDFSISYLVHYYMISPLSGTKIDHQGTNYIARLVIFVTLVSCIDPVNGINVQWGLWHHFIRLMWCDAPIRYNHTYGSLELLRVKIGMIKCCLGLGWFRTLLYMIEASHHIGIMTWCDNLILH